MGERGQRTTVALAPGGAAVRALVAASALAGPVATVGASEHAGAASDPPGPDVASDRVQECLIEPMTVAAVGTPVPATVASLEVDRGYRVSAGQPLATLDSGLEAATVDLAEASAESVSEIAAREADLELADLQLERASDMRAENLVSEQSFQEAEVRRRVAAAALVQALEGRRLRQLEAVRAREGLERRTIRSPVDGGVVERHRFPGEFVHDDPIVTVAVIDPLRVEVVLPARLFGTVAVGERAWVYPELGVGPGATGATGGADTDAGAGVVGSAEAAAERARAAAAGALVARVDVVDRVLDTASGTFGVRLVMGNADGTVAGGQRCRVAFGPVSGPIELATDDGDG